MNPRLQIERSIITKYRKPIWHNFTRALNAYRLIEPGDHIAACISGGKDSFLLAKLLQEVQRHGEVPFRLSFLTMDPGYNPLNRRLIEENAALMGLDLAVFDTDIFRVVAGMDKNPCYMCARMRRGHLYKNARTLGANKIALGHHFDDVIETILMSMLYGAEMKTMMPKLRSANYEGMELIRPLYMVRERDIVAWRDYNRLTFLRCACRFTEQDENNAGNGKRAEIKALIAQLRKVNPNVEMNIFRSCHDVNLDTLIGYKKGGVAHPFVEEYGAE
ncbi:MAG: tRNA 2-thiocytidine biosynthesis protein TtcA [Clostridiales bacterium]|nr:tRNA 2-thiocytidine biosynthesis protein TtcA [Clostridiales bacterium]